MRIKKRKIPHYVDRICLVELKKKKLKLKEIQKDLNNLTKICICNVCERLLVIVGKITQVKNIKTDIENKIKELEIKIKEAKGNENKQKRKKLQRKLKELKLENGIF